MEAVVAIALASAVIAAVYFARKRSIEGGKGGKPGAGKDSKLK